MLGVLKHKIFIKWGFVLCWEEGLLNSKEKIHFIVFLKNGLTVRSRHKDMLQVSWIWWEAELLEGIEKRKSSWLHGTQDQLLGQPSFFLTRQGDLKGLSVAEGALSAKGEEVGVSPTQSAATSRVPSVSLSSHFPCGSQVMPDPESTMQVSTAFFQMGTGQEQVHDNESKQTSKQQQRG